MCVRTARVSVMSVMRVSAVSEHKEKARDQEREREIKAAESERL